MPSGTVGMDLQLGPRHRNQFGFGLDGLAHGDGLPPGALVLLVLSETNVGGSGSASVEGTARRYFGMCLVKIRTT